MRIRFVVILAAVAALFVGQEAFGKTKAPVVAMQMQGVLSGSVKKAVMIAIIRPVTTPLLEWARAAADKAREDRKVWQAQKSLIDKGSESDFVFSRDRD